MIYSDGTFVPNTFAGSPIGEVAREARLALNFGVRVKTTEEPPEYYPVKFIAKKTRIPIGNVT